MDKSSLKKQVGDYLADQNVDTTDTDLRYMAYGARLRTALRAAQRYIAYVRAFIRWPPISM